MPLDESSDTAGPEAGFLLAFGFFGSRLPRFIPLAIIPSRAVGYVRSVVQRRFVRFRACDITPSRARQTRDTPSPANTNCGIPARHQDGPSASKQDAAGQNAAASLNFDQE